MGPVRARRMPLAAFASATLAAVSVACAASIAGAAIAVPAAHAATDAAPRTTLPIISRQVMCVTCKIPLDVAESPQADLEREYIQGLINQGEGEAEIKRSLVAQYGPTVLGLPSTHGFDLAAYLVPVAVVLGLLATVLALLPGWRRRARAQTASRTPTATLSAADAAKLDADLARFD